MAARTRAANRAAMESEIRRLGREHLSTHGAAGLSLRAIARDLGVVSSAVYRYVPSRDELLTLLLVEAYTDLAQAVTDAVGTAPQHAHRERILLAAHAVRGWAVADPARWALLYGSPVPGYSAPPDATVGPGTRVIALLLAEVSAADEAGLLRSDTPLTQQPDTNQTGTPAALLADLAAIRAEFGITASDAAVLGASIVWATLQGAVGLEVFGQYGTGTLTDPAALFGAQLRGVLALLFD